MIIKKTNTYKILLILLLEQCFLLIYAQEKIDLIQNGSFENGQNNRPNDRDQINKCDYWQNETFGADWYTTKDFTDAYKGPCPFAGLQLPASYGGCGSAESDSMRNIEPKMNPHSGSFYAGLGDSQGEVLYNELKSPTIIGAKIKLSFWLAKRYDFKDTVTFKAQLQNSFDQNLDEPGLEIMRVTIPTDLNPPACTWIQVSSKWVEIDASYSIIRLQGSVLYGGNLCAPEYIYVDDFELIQGNCCPDHWLYENTTTLPRATNVDNYIVAGRDAGIPNFEGDVVVKSGQEVFFRAGDYIDLLPGFDTEDGAKFTAEIKECNPITTYTGGEIIFYKDAIQPAIINSDGDTTFVFSPNGDGINDQICITVYGADKYTVKIFDRGNLPVYTREDVAINSNKVCIWDGKNQDGDLVNQDTYFITLFFDNCDHQSIQKMTVRNFNDSGLKINNPNPIYQNQNDKIDGYSKAVVLNNENKLHEPESQDFKKKQSDTFALKIFVDEFEIHPNPFNNQTTINYTISKGENVTILVKNLMGKTVSKIIDNEYYQPGNHEKHFEASNLSQGIYFCTIQSGAYTETKKMVIVR